MNKNFKMILIIAAVVIAVILFCVIGVSSVQNTAIVYEEQINTAKSGIDVQEKRRVDLLYNLVDAVKEYDQHEYETLKDVVDSRSAGGGDISDVATMIDVAAEAYPDLKSSDNYKQLMLDITTTENLIAEYRNNYNDQVKRYRRYVRNVINKFFLNMQGYEALDVEYLEFDAPEDAPKLFED